MATIKPDFIVGETYGPHKVIAKTETSTRYRQYLIETTCCGRETRLSQTGLTHGKKQDICLKCRKELYQRERRGKREDTKKPYGFTDEISIAAFCKSW